MRERRDETGVGTTIEVAERRERQRHIERDNDDGDDDNGEQDDQTINSKSTFRPPQSRKDTITYSACIMGVRLRYWRHGTVGFTKKKDIMQIRIPR